MEDMKCDSNQDKFDAKTVGYSENCGANRSYRESSAYTSFSHPLVKLWKDMFTDSGEQILLSFGTIVVKEN